MSTEPKSQGIVVVRLVEEFSLAARAQMLREYAVGMNDPRINSIKEYVGKDGFLVGVNEMLSAHDPDAVEQSQWDFNMGGVNMLLRGNQQKIFGALRAIFKDAIQSGDVMLSEPMEGTGLEPAKIEKYTYHLDKKDSDAKPREVILTVRDTLYNVAKAEKIPVQTNKFG